MKLTNGQVREALQGSIRKWERIVAGKGEDHGVDNCPLCKMFYDLFTAVMCAGCPVCIESGMSCCLDTPYLAWSRQFQIGEWPKLADTPERRACAKKELDFLRALDRKFFVEGVMVK